MPLLNYIFRVILLLPCVFFFYFPSQYNLDYSSYYYDYEYSLFTYDILYEWSSYAIKTIFSLSFDDYWFLLMIIQVLLLAIVYNRTLLILIAYPVIISLSQFLYGTQVRYSIAIVLFLISFKMLNKTLKSLPIMIIPLLFHYGIVFTVLIAFASKKIDYSFLIISKFKSLFLITIFIALINIMILNIDSIIGLTRFKYYSGSETYFGQKSWSSIIFIISFLFALLYGVKKNVNYRTSIMKLSIMILIFCLSTSSIAILSGRVLLVFLVILPILIYELVKTSRITPYTCLLITLYLIMNISYYFKNDYYFY